MTFIFPWRSEMFPQPDHVVPGPDDIHCTCMDFKGDNDRCPIHGANRKSTAFGPIEFLIGFWVVAIGLCATLVFVLFR